MFINEIFNKYELELEYHAKTDAADLLKPNLLKIKECDK